MVNMESMTTLPSNSPVTAAHEKTVAVRDDVRQAEADLRDVNEALSDSVGTLVTRESVEAALAQNLHVENQLHDAVKELEVVSDLLEDAQEEKAAREREHGTMAGRRSGEGAGSVLKHMATSAKAKEVAR